ncbi:hypothetical protein ACFV19_02415, partial [Streptomyces griseoluteus]
GGPPGARAPPPPLAGDGRADLLVGSDEDGGDGALTYLPSDGTKITTKGARLIGVKDVGVSATGTPWFGSIIATEPTHRTHVQPLPFIAGLLIAAGPRGPSAVPRPAGHAAVRAPPTPARSPPCASASFFWPPL